MLFVLAGVFVATALLVVATHRFAIRRRLAAAELVRTRLSPVGPALASVVPILKRELRASQLEFLNRALSGKPVTAAIARELERGGSGTRAGWPAVPS